MKTDQILNRLDSLGCVPRIDGGKFVISNAKRIDADLRAAIAENRDEIIELVTPPAEYDEMDPVLCGSCGDANDVYVLPDWICSKCHDGAEERRQATSRWIKHRNRITNTKA